MALPNGPHLRILAGTLAGQAIGYVSYPFLLAIYSPAQFGVFSTVLAIATPLSLGMGMRLDLVLSLIPEASRARAVAAGSALWLLGAGLLLSVALICIHLVLGPDGWPILHWLWQVPILASLLAVLQNLVAVAIRERRFGILASRLAGQGLLTAALQILMGVVGALSLGLVAGLGLSAVVACLSLIGTLALFPAFSRGSLQEFWRSVGEYRREVASLTPATLLNSMSLWLPVLVVASTYGPASAGVFALAQRLLSIPVGVLIQVVGQVYLSDASAERRAGNSLVHLFLRTSRRVAIASLAGWLVILLLGPHLVRWAFGVEWRTAGDLLIGLSLGVAVQMIVSPVSQTLALIGRARVQLAWDVARFFAVALVLFIDVLVLRADLTALTWALSLASAAMYALLWVLNSIFVRRG